MKKYLKFIIPPAAALLVTLLIGAGVLRRVDKWTQDRIYQRRGVTSGDIIIIGIDDEALDEIGPYQTWDRNVMASALEALNADPDKKPAAVGVDILYAGYSTDQPDQRLADAAAELGNVVTASMAEFGERVDYENGRAAGLSNSAVIGYYEPYPELKAGTVQGHINAMNDKDGVLRHALLYVDIGENRVYSMACEAARLYLEQSGKSLTLPPVGKTGHFYVPFSGKAGDYYDGVSIAMLISGRVPPDYWAGKIVLIGPYATALQDAHYTSIDRANEMYGIEFQANVIQSLIEKKFKIEIPDLPQLIALFVICTAAMAVFLRLRVLRGTGVFAGILAFCGAVTIILYKAGVVIHPLWVPTGISALFIASLAIHYSVAARERRALAIEKAKVKAELSLAARIQSSSLPKEFPPFPERKEFELYASMTPARDVGGDFYDFFLIDDDHLGLVIADVSGKGIPASLFMMVSTALIHLAAVNATSPAKTLQQVNNQICFRNPEQMFVTVWLGILEISTGKLTAANAGHEFPAIMNDGGSFELLHDKHGFVIGGMEGVRYREYEVLLTPGAKVFVYTDGVPEANNIKEEFYGTDRMVQALRAHEDESPEDILKAVKADIAEFVGEAPQFDDLTMLCLQYNGGQRTPES